MSIRVLVIEDNDSIRKMVWANLRVAGMDVCEAVNGKEGVDEARSCLPDVIVLDIMMPVMDGLEACRILREDPLTSSAYIIMLTAKSRVEDTVEGLGSGADDYMAKPFEPDELIARIKRGAKTAEERRNAMFDSLTRLMNRRAFDQLFHKEWARTQRHNLQVSLILLDFDHFKNVNDSFGHAVGDEVLKQLAELLRTNTRASDLPCRWGGEEFVIILPETSAEEAANKAEALRKEIETTDFGAAGHLTASFGVTAPKAGELESDVFERLDKALYDAKEGGRNRVVRL